MTARLFSLVVTLAYRQLRRTGARVWWAVIIVAFIARHLDAREPDPVIRHARRYRVRSNKDLDIRFVEHDA